jgi:hypothetical protein
MVSLIFELREQRIKGVEHIKTRWRSGSIVESQCLSEGLEMRKQP